MLSKSRLAEIKQRLEKASAGPWEWKYQFDEEVTQDPDLVAEGIHTLPGPPHHIQLVANGQHRFWIELTDTRIAGDLVFDLDLIVAAHDDVRDLLAEVERLRQRIGEDV